MIKTMVKKKKYICFCIIIIFALSLLSGCVNRGTDNGVPLDHMAQKIQKDGKLEVVPAGIQYSKEQMDLDENDYASMIVMKPKADLDSDELVLIKADNNDGVTKAMEKLAERRDDMLEKWGRVGGVQYEKVKNNVIKSEGLYVLYVVSSEPKEAVKAFDGYFG